MAKVSKQEASRFLGKVPGDYVFRCNDSCLMSDLNGLAQALGCMTNETYAYHANATKNDFSTWVSDIIGDQELAESLKRATNRMEAATMVAQRVAFLSKRAKQKS